MEKQNVPQGKQNKEDVNLKTIRHFQGSVKNFTDYWNDRIKKQKK